MIIDVNDYILNLLVMDITGFQLLFPSVQFGSRSLSIRLSSSGE